MRFSAIALGLALALSACTFVASSSSAPPPRASLLEAAQRYEDAQIAGDAAVLQELVADDYVLVGGDGLRRSKDELIAFWTAPGFDPEPVTIADAVEHIWADGAALGGTVTLQGMSAGEPFSTTIRYIDVWELRDGQWRVVYGQSTRAPTT